MPSLEPLANRVAVVTGAGSGIGLATTRRLAASGAHVHAIDFRAEVMEERLADERRTGLVAMHGLDVTDAAAVERLITEIGAEKPIEILVCAAGTNVPERRFAQLSEQNWRTLIDTNLGGVFSCMRAAMPQLRETAGHVVVMSSVSALWPDQSGAAYQASKAGVTALARAASFEEHGNGVRFTIVAPGMVDTELILKRPSPPSADVRKAMLQADDVAAAILCALSLPPRACLAEITIVPTILQSVGKTQV